MAYTTIDDPGEYFNTVLWTGNATDDTAITGVGFSPDWVWIKNRSTTEAHHTADSVIGAAKRLRTNTTGALGNQADGVKSFDSNGITIGTTGSLNGNGNSIVGWFWKAGGSASSNSNGSITSSVSASTDSGFSIVSYTGNGSSATVGHGLGVAPNVIITKKTNAAAQWNFQNSIRGYNEYMALNTTEASQATSGAIISAVSSTTYSCDGNDVVNANSGTYVSYCFAEKKGYSKFGSYTGNGNADGTFVYIGFKPAFVVFKRTDSAGNWLQYDIKRDTDNPNPNILIPNLSNAETSGGTTGIDILSNGIKFRNGGTGVNNSGSTYIYMAFAEVPFKYSLAR